VVATKALLYLLLFGDAIYWAVFGRWLDAWDAFLWLFAFMAIDFNGLRLSDEPVRSRS